LRGFSDRFATSVWSARLKGNCKSVLASNEDSPMIPFMLDSNTCIQFLNGKSALVEQRLRGTKPSNIKLCSVVKAELLYGAFRSNNPP
jgi:hypothetical protein